MTERSRKMAQPPPKSSPPARSVRAKRWALRLLYFILACVVLYFVVRALARNISKVSWDEITLSPGFIVLSFMCMLALRCLSGLALHVVLGSLGSGIGWHRAMAIGWIGNLARYIPGRVLTVASQLVLLRRAGVRSSVAVISPFLVMALTIPVAVIMATPLLTMHEGLRGLRGGWTLIVVTVLAGVVCLHPHVFITLSNIVLRRMHRETIPTCPTRRKLLLATAVLAVKLCLFGTALWMVARSLVHVDAAAWPYFVATAACARVSTFLAFFAPAGMGVREGMYLLLLGPVLGPGPAALVAVVARLVAICSDLIIGSAAVPLLRHGTARESRP